MTSASPGWKRVRIGDIAKVISGYAFKSKYFRDKGVPVIKIKNIRVGYVDVSDVQCVDPVFLSSLDEKYHVVGGNLLISLTGSHLTQPGSVVGRVAIHSYAHSRCLLNQRAGKIILERPDQCNTRYLFYALSTQDAQRSIALMAHGAASQANVSPRQVESLELHLPSLPTQHKIAAVLSAYDDLIENNTRRIAVLEEMARLLYREWFVHFRFPGHEDVAMVDSELGPVTEGWEVVKVKAIVKRLKARKAYEKASVSEVGQVPVIDQSRDAVLGFHDNEPDHRATPDDPIIIFGDHTCKMQLMVEPFSVGPNVVPFISEGNIPIAYLYFLVNNLVETHEYKRHWTELMNKQVVLSPSTYAERFAEFSKSVFEQTDSLARMNAVLRRTRDLLLPRLVSGEVDVSELEIDIGGLDA